MADDVNPDEVPEGWDIFNETTSRFRKLLDNQILLDQFLNEDLHDSEQEIQTDFKNEILDDENDENNNDPETSYLRISAHLRQALKKHLPWVNIVFFFFIKMNIRNENLLIHRMFCNALLKIFFAGYFGKFGRANRRAFCHKSE